MDIARKREATYMQQSVEWGMHAIQSSFLPFEEYDQRRRITTRLFLLFNLRAHLVGINQIRTLDMSELNDDANLEFIQVP
jgi:hypothetical protein